MNKSSLRIEYLSYDKHKHYGTITRNYYINTYKCECYYCRGICHYCSNKTMYALGMMRQLCKMTNTQTNNSYEATKLKSVTEGEKQSNDTLGPDNAIRIIAAHTKTRQFIKRYKTDDSECINCNITTNTECGCNGCKTQLCTQCKIVLQNCTAD